MSYPVHAESPVGELAAHVPGSARVFDRLGLDFCCGGGQTLSAACAEHGLAVDGVMRELEAEAAAHAGTVTDAARWNQAPLGALCDYIVTRHHQYIRSEVPRIERWLEKCVAAHGARHPELARMRETFAEMTAELSQHMAKEELVLFPAIRRLSEPQRRAADIATPTLRLDQPVRTMLLEHEHAGRDLAELRQESAGYTPPPDACATFRALYQALEIFETDMRDHVHLENNILFPRALDLEKNASAAATH